jgi:hypothetical protein
MDRLAFEIWSVIVLQDFERWPAKLSMHEGSFFVAAYKCPGLSAEHVYKHSRGDSYE